MYLHLALSLTGFGFVAFLLGSVFDMAEVAVIGAVIVVGVGAMVTGTGLEYRDGETVEKVYGGENNSTLVSEQVSPEYTELDTPQHLSVGMLWMLLGGTMTLRGINRAS